MNLKARTLFGLVFAAGFGLLLAILILLHSSLGMVAEKTNELDSRRAEETAQAAITTAIDNLSATLTDNAVWNGAQEEVYRRGIEPRWLYSTWGNKAKDQNAYDGIFLLDSDYRILWGYIDGKPYPGGSIARFGAGFNALIKADPAQISSGERVAVGLSETWKGPAIVGLSLIRRSDSGIDSLGEARRYLVMTRHLTPAMLKPIGATFGLADLRLAPSGADIVPAKALRSPAGPIGQLTWKSRKPGMEAARAAAWGIRKVALATALIILLFTAASAFGLYRLSKSEKLARSFAMTDGLSGLPNRRALFELVQKSKSGRGPVYKTVVYLDLDGFKEVNDIYGHATGDKLIMIVAAMLKGILPPGAMLARMGGDEFAMVLTGPEAMKPCLDFAKAILDFLAKPVRIGERSLQVGASIGIASADIKQVRSQELFRRADMAMYESKNAGKNRITLYDAELDAERLRKANIEAGIRKGLDNDEFDVVYQPIIDARTGAMCSVEALVRWPRRPEGPMFPDQFIDVAESSGLIHPLGQFVLRKACLDLGAVSGLRLSVNLSPAQFRDPELEAKVARTLEETGFPTDRLELEVTEGYLIENPARAIAAIANLKALGVSMALDDFGTGYSSIGYLRRYAFDKIKIDKSMAGTVDRDPQAAALVAGTVAIAQALNISVTAEGVETEDHVRLLKLAGCQYMQGYYYSRPKPLAEVLKLREGMMEVA
ncbi:MAG: EAL domain-containing protein [Asticcacaulis sp.]|uniref:putative bifunctional diguanylate cyclase/phosphodiesterase n=1 Tax=Asticcacaulis sp. TaxID=1872648 RepID=UPI0039E60099